MAVGGPSSWLLRVKWDDVTYVDESAYVAAEEGAGITIVRGRGSPADDVQPGALAGVWRQDEVGALGRHVAGNALSPLFPHVTDGPRVRFQATRGASVSDRFTGRLALAKPLWPNGSAAGAIVPFQGVGRLGELAGQTLRGDFVERWVNSAETAAVDLWDYPDALAPTSFVNLGSSTGTAEVIRPVSKVGKATVETAEGIDVGNAVVLTAVNAVGPVVQYTTGIRATDIVRCITAFRTTDRTVAGGPDKWLASGLDEVGGVLWSVRLKDNGGQCDVNIYDGAGTFLATLYFGFAPSGTGSTDDQWFTLLMTGAGATTNVFLVRTIDDTVLTATGLAFDIRNMAALVLGGQASRTVNGKQTNCVTAAFGPVVLADVAVSHTAYLQTGDTEPWATRVADLNFYCNFGSTTTGTRNRDVARKSLVGRNAFDVTAELMRTAGTLVVESRINDNSLFFFDSDTQRLPTVAVTLDADLDLDGGAFDWTVGEGPSSVTAKWPGGQVTYTDTSRVLSEQDVETTAADENSARDVAASRALSFLGRRLERVIVDVAGASNDLWVAMMALEIGQRIRVTIGVDGSPLVQQLGVRYVDLYVVGIEEFYARDVCMFTLDTVLADDPAEGVVEDADYGATSEDDGTMSVTGGTAIGTTANGTLIVTTTSGPTLDTDAASYPRELDWLGEWVTVSTPPASAVSPQTVTTTSRGAGATVARVHGTGEAITVALAATATI